MSLLSDKLVSVSAAQYLVAESVLSGIVLDKPNVAVANYSFAVQGGAVGTYNLALSKPIPQGSAVTRVVVVPSGVVGGVGYTYSLGVNNATDIANAVTPAALAYTSEQVRATADRYTLTFSIGTAALTAGTINFRVTFL